MKKLSPEEVEERVREKNPKLSLVYSSYISVSKNCSWIHEDFPDEPFTRKPSNLLNRGGTHPRDKKNLWKNNFKAKHGVEHPSQLPEIKTKISEKNLEKYGAACFLASEEGKQKSRKANLERFGTEVALESKEIRKRINKTCLEKYGVEFPLNSAEIRDKAKRTMEAKYGTPHFWQSEHASALEFWKKSHFSSRAERDLQEELSLLGIKNSKKRLEGIEIDIFLEEHGIGIEINGEYWHSDKFKPRDLHLQKFLKCKEFGIKLLQFWEGDYWRNKQKIIDFIVSKTSASHRIFARKTVVEKTYDSVFINSICKDWHMQGAPPNSEYAILLKAQGEVVGIGVISKHHRFSDQKCLSRLCFAPRTRVVGGLSKITSEVSKHEELVITWSDNFVSDGSSYVKSGWVLDKELPPDYLYYDVNRKRRVSKQSRRKRVVQTPAGMTELQHAEQDKLLRIWDAGKKRFLLRGKKNDN